MPLLRPLYGTTALLIVAGVIAGMPLGVQIIKSGLHAARQRAGGGLAHRRRLVVDHLPAHRAAPDGADPGGGGA